MPNRQGLTEQALAELIREGESEFVEFKMRLPPEGVVASHLAALSNKSGGYLIVGVNEKGDIVGLTSAEAKSAAERLARVAESLVPTPAEVGIIPLQGKHVVYAKIDPAPPHLRPVVTAEGSVFVRSGSTSLRLTPEQEAAYRRMPTPPRPAEPVRLFVAMSFRTEEEPALVDYRRAMERAIDASELPIEPVCIDLLQGDYEISQRIMDEVARCQIVLADFTLSPANVYFELGYARGRDKTIIQTARRGTQLEFDVRNWRTEFYRNATELEEKLRPALLAAYAQATGQT